MSALKSEIQAHYTSISSSLSSQIGIYNYGYIYSDSNNKIFITFNHDQIPINKQLNIMQHVWDFQVSIDLSQSISTQLNAIP